MSHNLAVVDYMADVIAVMCRGYIVEEAPKAALFRNPVHPYTQALLAAVPDPDIDRPLDFAKLMDERFSEPDGMAGTVPPRPAASAGVMTGDRSPAIGSASELAQRRRRDDPIARA